MAVHPVDYRPAFRGEPADRASSRARSDRSEALCERGVAPVPATHIAQVHEEVHRGGVVGWTLRADEAIDPLPRLTLSSGQASQIALSRCPLFTFSSRAFADLTLASGVEPLPRDRFGLDTQFASGA